MHVNEMFKSFSDEVKRAFVRKFNDYFEISKCHTIAVIPFFGLLCRYGNEVRPVLSHTDMNTLYFMTSGFNGYFKDTIVYPGKSLFMTNDLDQLLEFVKFQSKQQYILSRILNKSIGFSSLNQEKESYQEILAEYKCFLENFDEMCEKYPLPYNTAFDIKDIDELINYLDNLYCQSIKSDEFTRILLVCSTEFFSMQPSEYEKIKKVMTGINGYLYLGHSCADQYLGKIYPYFSTEDKYDNPVVHNLQDFAVTYNKQISQEAMNAFALEIIKVYEMIMNDESKNMRDNILSEIEQINVENIYIKYHSRLGKPYKRVKQ